jgi:hypothetical protein
MLDRTPKADIPRRRRYVARQAAGLICLNVEIPEHDFAKAIVKSTRLTAEQALHRAELEKAVGQIVADFIERWGGRVP